LKVKNLDRVEGKDWDRVEGKELGYG